MRTNARKGFTKLALSAFGISLLLAAAVFFAARSGQKPRSATVAAGQTPVIFIPAAQPHAPSPRSKRPVATPGANASPSPSASAPAIRSNETAAPATVAPLQPNASAPIAAQPTVAPLSPQNGTLPPVPVASPDAYPRIVAVTLSTPVVSGGDVVTAGVETSSNVASVEARIGGYSATFQKTGVGRFTLAYKVPRLPFFLHKSYLIQIIARNTAGTGVSTAVPITVR